MKYSTLGTLLAPAFGLTACGGGGPGVSGPEAETLFADYSATWALDEDVSDSIPGPESRRGGEGGRGGGAFGGGGADPFGGASARGGGGMPPEGMSGGRGGMGRGRGGVGPGRGRGLDPNAMEGMRHLLAAVRQRPETITLALDDSTFSFIQTPGGRTAVPIMGEEVELSRTSWPIKAKVEWDDGKPTLKRDFENGGAIEDHFELVSRDRLVVTRKVEGGPNDVEFRFVYDREASDGDESK